jgi:GT2 family glycosyltransferase
MISVVCAYNNAGILKDWLLESLKAQTVEHELILIDTVEHGFQSAAQALNSGGNQARGKYIMFVHQDVRLISNSWLKDAEEMLDTLPNLGIAGVVGSVEEGRTVSDRMRNVIRHGDDSDQIGNSISSPERVQTLDELLCIIPREVFQRYQFDEDTCSNWHLYGVDYCLTMLTLGKGVYVIPFFVIHKSTGAADRRFHALSFLFHFGLSSGFFQTLEKVLRKHQKKFVWIYTTPGYGKWKTTEPLFIQRLKYSIIEMLQWFAVRIKSFMRKK